MRWRIEFQRGTVEDATLGHRRLVTIAILACLFSGATGAEKRPIDAAHSKLTVHVGKTGVFSGASHNHEIVAPISRGDVDASKPFSVSFDVNVAAMKVVDADGSEKDRADVQQRMLGPEVLDAAQFHEIHFASESVESIGDSRWRVHGRLTLHGQTKPIVLETSLENGHYRGTATVLQTDFGITPIKVAGGTVKVKDEVQIEYDIVLAGK
nr:YceI family protein [Candidatus Acidoferrales bacterium]